MLRSAVVLDATMTASKARGQLARHGYWLDPSSTEVVAYLQGFAAVSSRPGLTIAEAARRFARSLAEGRAAIRREHGIVVHWHVLLLEEVLTALSQAPDHAALGAALGLGDLPSAKTLPVEDLDERAEKSF